MMRGMDPGGERIRSRRVRGEGIHGSRHRGGRVVRRGEEGITTETQRAQRGERWIYFWEEGLRGIEGEEKKPRIPDSGSRSIRRGWMRDDWL